MDLDAFERSLAASEPPAGLPRALEGVWWARKGDWERAHELVGEDEEDRGCAWVHAALHREEGDLENAQYWYERARRPVARTSYAAELGSILRELASPPGA